jgi:hyperosmotically inducible periplasmic protein
MFEPKSTIVFLGTCSLIFGAATANAQVDADSLGRAADGVSTAGRAPGEVAAEAGVGAEVDGGARGVRDAELGVHVQSLLTQQIAMPGVHANVHNGVVTLNGTVATEADKQRAEEIARRVVGVTRVRNELVAAEARTRAAGPSTEAAVTQSLRADARLAQRDIDVRARNDVVTLTGEVTSVAEKETAGRIAAEAAAGTEVRNRLVVSSKD